MISTHAGKALGRRAVGRHGGRRSQHGQALAEMVIALIVLVPLAAGVMLLGQYMHIKQQTQSAARAAAWEAAVSPELALQEQMPDRARVLQNLRTRHFAGSKARIGGSASGTTALGDPMHTTFAGQELLKFGGIDLTVYQQEVAPSALDNVLSGVDQVLGPLGMGDTLPPNREGMITAEVHARPELIRDRNGNPLVFLDPLDHEALDFSARTVLLADAWNAAGGGENRDGSAVSGANNRTVRKVVQPLMPTGWAGDGVIGTLNDVMQMLGRIPILDGLLTAGWGEIQFGKVAPDAVPADKLVKYATQD